VASAVEISTNVFLSLPVDNSAKSLLSFDFFNEPITEGVSLKPFNGK
jgi:hypothetical protein